MEARVGGGSAASGMGSEISARPSARESGMWRRIICGAFIFDDRGERENESALGLPGCSSFHSSAIDGSSTHCRADPADHGQTQLVGWIVIGEVA